VTAKRRDRAAGLDLEAFERTVHVSTGYRRGRVPSTSHATARAPCAVPPECRVSSRRRTGNELEVRAQPVDSNGIASFAQVLDDVLKGFAQVRQHQRSWMSAPADEVLW